MTAIDAHQHMWDPVKADYPRLGPEPDIDADTQLMLHTAGKFPQNCSRGGREVLEQVSVLPRCPELVPELSARHEARSQTIRFTGWTTSCFPILVAEDARSAPPRLTRQTS